MKRSIWKVTIILPDGNKEHFGDFNTREDASYNVALAKTAPGSVYLDRKYVQ